MPAGAGTEQGAPPVCPPPKAQSSAQQEVVPYSVPPCSRRPLPVLNLHTMPADLGELQGREEDRNVMTATEGGRGGRERECGRHLTVELHLPPQAATAHAPLLLLLLRQRAGGGAGRAKEELEATQCAGARPKSSMPVAAVRERALRRPTRGRPTAVD